MDKENPEYYAYEPKGEFIDFIYDYATFRGDDGKTLLEVYYGVPINKLKFKEDGEFYSGSYKTGIFLHDSGWNRKLEDIQVKAMRFRTATTDITSDDIAVDRFVYQVDPGLYNFAIEMQDLNSDNVGTYRDDVTIEAYGSESLQMSDIQVAWNIAIVDAKEIITKDNLRISPNPRRVYGINQPVYIYYELYNLSLDDMSQKTDYTVYYSIRYDGERQVSLTGYIRNLFVNENQEMGVTTEFKQSGALPDESQFLRIDQSLTEPGPYILTLKIKDNHSGITVEKSVQFHLFNNR